jgi:hypothetical protein
VNKPTRKVKLKLEGNLDEKKMVLTAGIEPATY